MALGLRGRFTLGFGLAALLTITAAALVTRQIVSSRYRAEFERTLAGAEAAAREAVEAEQRSLLQVLDGVATRDSPMAGAVLIDLLKNDGELSAAARSELRRRSQADLQSLGIDVLVIVDRADTVLAAPHFGPSAIDTQDPLPRRLARAGGAPRVEPLRVLRKGTVVRVPMLAAARTVSDGRVEVTVLVARALGHTLVGSLERDGVVEARLVDAAGAELATTEPSWAARLGGAPTRQVVIPGENGTPAARLIVAVPRAELERALADVTLGSAAFGFLAVLLATMLGYFIARRITHDLDALVGGAQAVSRGDLEHRVEVRRHDELGELAETFNAMTGELRDSKERLVQAERVAAWQDIARAIAHEIKNPLTPIQMSVETLRKTWASQHPSFQEIFEESTLTVLQEVARLKRIVSEFSQFARLPRPALVACDLDELVGGALSLYKGSVRVVSELSGSLPAVSADRDQMTQVVLNLLENARDAVASRGSEQSIGRITVRTRRREGTIGPIAGVVELEIEDNGPGFDAAIREKLFEPYFTTKAGGTGLGLAIVRRIVTDHGGRVSAQGELGKGARFTIELPAARR
jgi:two-component system nitrogen regulation sensor histidine kinase NtrY